MFGFITTKQYSLPSFEQLSSDVICDVALAIQNAVQASSMTDQLTNTLKQMASMDTPIENTTQNLQQMNEVLDSLEDDCQKMENTIEQVTDVMDRLQSIERHKYFCAENNKEMESDFDRSDYETSHP